MKKDAINLTVSVLHNDKQYDGITIHNGVGFTIEDLPCAEGKVFVFTNTVDAPKGVLFQGVSNVDVPAIPFRPYLQLKPIVSPAK